MKNKSTECSLRQVHAVVVLNSQVSHSLYMCRNVLISVIDFSSYTGLFILVTIKYLHYSACKPLTELEENHNIVS